MSSGRVRVLASDLMSSPPPALGDVAPQSGDSLIGGRQIQRRPRHATRLPDCSRHSIDAHLLPAPSLAERRPDGDQVWVHRDAFVCGPSPALVDQTVMAESRELAALHRAMSDGLGGALAANATVAPTLPSGSSTSALASRSSARVTTSPLRVRIASEDSVFDAPTDASGVRVACRSSWYGCGRQA